MYWYCNQTFCVRWGNCFSDCFTVSNGVRQGGIISPILFNVYMDDLSTVLNKSKIGCNINNTFINHLMYADDTCILAPCPMALQKLLNICSSFADVNSIVFNEGKTKLMCFKPKCMSDLSVPAVSLNGKPINIVKSQKYLGIVINDELSDEPDIKRHVRGLYCRGNMLVNRFRNCTPDVKNCLFKAYCSNAYGSQLWSFYKPAILKKVIVAFNDVYRNLFGIRRGESMSALYVLNNIDSFNVLQRKSVYSFKTRLQMSKNTLIQTIVTSQFYYISKLACKWHKILYL